jgi:cytochrome c
MKKIALIFIAFAMFTACGGGGSKEEKKDTPVVAENDLSKNPDYQKGLDLVAKSDCFTCHKIDDVLTGPPYREVANKYAGLPDTIITHLAGKIINGGAGVWGQVFMTPHAGVAKEDAEAMVKYILLLKK